MRDHLHLRTEAATHDVPDYRVNKAVDHLPQLREKMTSLVLLSGKRVPGRKLDHPRQLALRHALVRFANIATASPFTTRMLLEPRRTNTAWPRCATTCPRGAPKA